MDDLRHSKTLTLLLLTVTENALSFNNTLKGGGGFLATDLLQRKVYNCHILETRPHTDNLFAQVCSIEDSSDSFKSRPYFTSHVIRRGKKTKTRKV